MDAHYLMDMEDKSLFIQFMGESPTIKILDYLLTERELDFSITDMAENSGIGRATLYRIWDSLIKNKIIVHTRIIGKAKLFRLNMDNLKIKKLIEIHDMLILEEIKKHQQIKVVAKQFSKIETFIYKYIFVDTNEPYLLSG